MIVYVVINDQLNAPTPRDGAQTHCAASLSQHSTIKFKKYTKYKNTI